MHTSVTRNGGMLGVLTMRVRRRLSARYWQISRSSRTAPSVMRNTNGMHIPTAVFTGVLSSATTEDCSGVMISVRPRALMLSIQKPACCLLIAVALTEPVGAHVICSWSNWMMLKKSPSFSIITASFNAAFAFCIGWPCIDPLRSIRNIIDFPYCVVSLSAGGGATTIEKHCELASFRQLARISCAPCEYFTSNAPAAHGFPLSHTSDTTPGPLPASCSAYGYLQPQAQSLREENAITYC